MDCKQPVTQLIRVEEEMEVAYSGVPVFDSYRNIQPGNDSYPTVPGSKCDQKFPGQRDGTENKPNLPGHSQSPTIMDYRTSRHQSLPLDGGTRVLAAERRRRSSPIAPSAPRTRGSHPINCSNQDSRSNLSNLFSPAVCLEPIPQGQELSVHSTHWPYMSAMTSGAATGDVTNETSLQACCGCREQQHNGGAWPSMMDSKNGVISHSSKDKDSLSNQARNEHTKSPSSTIPGSQWARDFIGRLRSNSTIDSTEAKSLEHLSGRRGSTPRSAQETLRSMQTSDGIDPRRLPKTNGPSSAHLQFSKKPLNVGQSSTPIPVTNDRSSLLIQSAVVASTSWRQRRKAPKVPWLSQSSSVASGPPDLFFGPSSLNARLSYSAVEEFRGAVDLLAGRQQISTPTGKVPMRTGVRVKRASESDRFLVISKSLSDSREEFSPCALEHFDENHVYNTLFRHSTCYDVLPDSGKLVILDSRLGIVRAIRALLENGIPAAPIWHSATQSVTGLLSQELALHLLTSLLCCTENKLDEACSITPTDHHALMCGDHAKPKSIADGLRHWGAQHLSDVLRLFHSDPGKSRYSPAEFDPTALFVSPQTGLKRALCRLIHYSHRTEHRMSRCYAASLRENQTSDYRSLSSSLSSELSTGRPVQQPLPGNPPSNKPNPLPCPTHLIVINAACGNVLGVLGVDRLLAYLRLRLDELPYSPQMLFTIDSIPGLRWTDRQRLFRSSPFRLRKPLSGELVDTEAADSIPEPPVIYPQTSCRQALCSLTQWLSQLPAIPVVTPTSGAATAVTSPSPLIGLIAPGDLLHFFLDGCPDTAASQPVSKILEVKLAHCRFLHECVCHTQETLVDALDRMFRLRTPCLVLFDAPKVHSTTHTLCGPPIGMLTAKDLLCAILGTNPHHHHHHHHHHQQQQQHNPSSDGHSPPSADSKWLSGSSPMDVFEDDLRSVANETLGDTLEQCASSSSSSDEHSSSPSSNSTYSARSGSLPHRDDSLSSRRSDHCRCSCHHKPMDTSGSSVEQLDRTKIPSSSRPFRTANQTVRFVDPSTPQSDGQRRNSNRRGEDDDALFSMD